MIETLLDNDFYQFTMCQAIWAFGHDTTKVRYEFRNRTFAVPLASRLDLDVLAKHIDDIRRMGFTDHDLNYLRYTGYFQEEFLNYLRTVRLPPVVIGSDNGHLTMTYEGNWGEAIFWETILLSVVNELYYDRFGSFTSEGLLRLSEKIDYLQSRKTITIVEFGTRRRFSAAWQHLVTHTLRDAAPELLLGTSNVHLADELDLRPVGTMAHQLFMVLTALWTQRSQEVDPIAAGAEQVLREWAHTYSQFPEMMTILPDTYTTKAFFKRVDSQLLSGYTGFRQDSGDPYMIGMRLQSACRLMGIPPKIVFSDSLDVRKMSIIEDQFPRVATPFGWGTNLTNDLGYEPLSIVIKPCAVLSQDTGLWIPCVKISDDPQKATGDPATIRQYLTAQWGVG